MPPPLNNVATLDRYDPSTTLEVPGGVRVNLSVLNASVFYSLGQGRPAPIYGDEIFAVPGFYSLDRGGGVDGVRVRSAVTGVPARVTLSILTADDVGGAE